MSLGISYILLDAARMQGAIYAARELNEAPRCLYEGNSEQFLGSHAPWLFDLEIGSHFSRWTADQGKGNSWGIIIESEADTEVIYHHLRKFLMVYTEEGKELYFRYYDPRVLRIFLPTCNQEQLSEFFESIVAFIMEDEEGKMIRFTYDKGELKKQRADADLEDFLIGEKIEWSILENSSPSKPSPTSIESKTKEKWDFGT